ncbi:MAG: DUF3631 domain-containing protein [Pseudonocardiaceae bacterium]
MRWPRRTTRLTAPGPGPQITSTGVRLLTDLRNVFTSHVTDRMTTADILSALHGLEESDWADLHGKPLDARRLGRELGKYGVRSKDIKVTPHPQGLPRRRGRASPTHGPGTCYQPRQPQLNGVADNLRYRSTGHDREAAELVAKLIREALDRATEP